MRLIDVDALNLDYEVDMADDWKTAHEIANVVKYAPTIDAVEVVRCKDCKWSDWYTSADGNRYCYCMETGMGGRTENDYCSYGERGDSECSK